MEIRKFDLHTHDLNSVATLILQAYAAEGKSISHNAESVDIVKDLVQTGNNFLGHENIYLCFKDKTLAGLLIGYTGKSYSKVKTIIDLLIKLRLTQALNYILVGSELFDAVYTPNISEQDFYISVIVVDENIRGIGVGAFLLNHAIETAKSRNCKRIVLDVNKDNLVAQALYKKLGFIEILNCSHTVSNSEYKNYYSMEYSLI